MNLTGQFNFTVAFDFTGVPSLILTASATIPLGDKPNLTGFFTITQPDGITTVSGTAIAWNGSAYPSYTVPLRLGSDQRYQKGNYSITLTATCLGYTNGLFTRVWDMEYKPVIQILVPGFDCFTPALIYTDTTIYGVGGYVVTAQSQSWSASCLAGIILGSAPIFDLSIGGKYYDCIYTISYSKFLTYQHGALTWLSVNEKFIILPFIQQAYKPAPMSVMLTYLINLQAVKENAKNNCVQYKILAVVFEDASDLYQIMRARVCSGNTSGLIDTFTQFYTLTHNYQPFLAVNTNGVIPAYDFTTGCVGGSGSGGTGGSNTFTAFYTAVVDGETVALFTLPVGARIDFVVRETKTLQPINYTWAAPYIILKNGIVLSAGETIEVHYATS